MRLIGFILVILGALALGYHGFAYAAHEKADEGGDETIRERAHTMIWVPPVVGGIAVVSGLLLVASARRPCEN